MSSPSWENLDDFLQLDTVGGFARPALITLQDGDTISINGIFDDPYVNPQLGEYEPDTSDPRFTCQSTLVQNVKRGDELAVNGKTYDVLTAPQHDGTGLAILKLAPQ